MVPAGEPPQLQMIMSGPYGLMQPSLSVTREEAEYRDTLAHFWAFFMARLMHPKGTPAALAALSTNERLDSGLESSYSSIYPKDKKKGDEPPGSYRE